MSPEKMSELYAFNAWANKRILDAAEKLSPGQEGFPLRMLSPYRTLSDDEFRQAQRTLRARFPDCE